MGGYPTTHADLHSGRGIHDALEGTTVLVHLATANGRRDVDMMRTLVGSLRALRAAGGEPPHLV
ncbi:MAG: hypothetical protein IPL94_00305 [Tetrasphaera sp.]|nr:hypothetical protein [Tetrasphaera sp.]